MITIPEDITPDDLLQWLDGGWFLWSDPDGAHIPVILRRTLNENGYYKVMDTAGNNYSSNDLALIHPYWPMCGAINLVCNRFAAFFRRIQRQQYRRTYTHRCVEMSTPKAADIRPLLNGVTAAREWVVDCIFNPKYYSYPEAELLFKNGWHSVAVTPHVIVVSRKEPLIYYKGTFAGRINGRTMMPINRTIGRRLLKQFNGELEL